VGRSAGKILLRQRQLRRSRQTAPLWNAKFTREMEKAYEQMWARYVEAGGFFF